MKRPGPLILKDRHNGSAESATLRATAHQVPACVELHIQVKECEGFINLTRTEMRALCRFMSEADQWIGEIMGEIHDQTG